MLFKQHPSTYKVNNRTCIFNQVSKQTSTMLPGNQQNIWLRHLATDMQIIIK